MIIISNGIYPDLTSSQTTEQPLLKIQYDNTLEETEMAFKAYQTRYYKRKNISYTVAYCILIAASIFLIATNPSSMFGYIALVLCAAFLYHVWSNPMRVRKRIIEALKDIKQETYTAEFFDDRMEIDTVIQDEENEVKVKIDETADEENIAPIVSVYKFGIERLDFEETDDALMVCAARTNIYCFPKRCLSAEQEEKLRQILTEKADS